MPIQHDVVCPVLIGRDAQLSLLRQLLVGARQGTGRVALLVGEAGVGKSRLLRTIAGEARESGFFVLGGACFEAERSIPYAPLLDLVRLFVGSSPPALVEHVLAPAASELVTHFPELRPLLPDAAPMAPSDPETDKRRLFFALGRAITAVARTQPVLLAFDDVHWSDDATLELIFHLARSHASHPVAIVLAYRGEEAGSRLVRLVADLQRARLVAELPLDRLRGEHVNGMLQAIFGAEHGPGREFAQLLYTLTEGNPFFVEETLKSLIVDGDLAMAEGRWRARPLERVRPPRTAVEAVRRRLAGLGSRARAVASTAAVAGRRFDFALLQAVTGFDEQALLAIMKELIAAQLVTEESADRFAFRHPLTQEAIYDELLARERVALHRSIADALERTSGSSAVIEALAHHSWAASDWDRAARYAVQAAHHALALSAPREAVAHLDRAFAAAERGTVTPLAEWSLVRGRANETLGEFQRAHDDFESALTEARRAGDRRLEWEALHALGMLWAARDYSRAGAHRLEALEVARSLGDESLVARSLNRVGNWYVNHEQPRAGLPFHQEALAILERLGDEGGVAETVDLIAMAYHIGGELPAAAAHFSRSVELFRARDDRRGLANALGLVALCGPSYQVSCTTPAVVPPAPDDFPEPAAIRLAREIDWRAGESFLRFISADRLAWVGEYDRALPMARESLAIAEELEHLEWTTGARRLLGVIALGLLAPEIAREHLEAAHRTAQQLGSRVWFRWTAAPLAVARARTNDVAAALALLDQAARGAEENASVRRSSGGVAEQPTLGERHLALSRAEVALSSGEWPVALEIARARIAAERAANAENALGTPGLHLVAAQALTALGRGGEAEQELASAREQAIAQGALPVLWRAECAIGELQRERRRRLDARRAFTAARAIVDQLAARLPDDELRSRLLEGAAALVPASPPPTARRAAKEAFGGLTQREREVARLVARGRANRAIARELGIGERTVEGHVANALAKLGFNSRAQLAGWAVEKGIERSTSR